MSGQTVKLRRPTKVKIGYQTFAVRYLKEHEWLTQGHDEHEGGSSWWGTGVINVRLENGTEQVKEVCLREVLLHEILHQCYEVGNLNKAPLPTDPDVAEEQIVGMLSFPLLQVLQDNPSVFAYISVR